MKYLVTGGCGFIGSNAVDYLVAEGHEVSVIDDLSSDVHDSFYYNEKAEYHKHSVTDYVICSDIFRRFKPDYVLHFAAEARIQNCIADPLKAFEVNSSGTLTMLELCKKYSVKKLVLSSTSAIYGNAEGRQEEQMKPDCLNPYSLSKLQGEEYCKMYGKLYGQDTVCLRYFNVYGPRNPSKGQYAPVIGIFKRQKAKGESLTIVGDGNQTRDFVHVNDVVKANYLATKADKQFFGEVFNVGSGKSFSVNEIASKIEKNKEKHSYLPARVGECRHTQAVTSKIEKELHWKCNVDLMSYLDNL
jgi:nucleoside-diphosphate-sugar epimerase